MTDGSVFNVAKRRKLEDSISRHHQSVARRHRHCDGRGRNVPVLPMDGVRVFTHLWNIATCHPVCLLRQVSLPGPLRTRLPRQSRQVFQATPRAVYERRNERPWNCAVVAGGLAPMGLVEEHRIVDCLLGTVRHRRRSDPQCGLPGLQQHLLSTQEYEANNRKLKL
jgi:hypothetical protein